MSGQRMPWYFRPRVWIVALGAASGSLLYLYGFGAWVLGVACAVLGTTLGVVAAASVAPRAVDKARGHKT